VNSIQQKAISPIASSVTGYGLMAALEPFIIIVIISKLLTYGFNCSLIAGMKPSSKSDKLIKCSDYRYLFYSQGRLDAVNLQKAVEYVLLCMNFDGGFGCRPGSESHAGQVNSVGLLSLNSF